jgi:hypothetical protein
VDWLAPFSELAQRKTDNVDYANTAALALNLLTPRVDVQAGIPALSTHLLLGGGLSYRLVVPYLQQAATTTTPANYKYDECLNSTHVANWATCIEFGVFAKYAL